jgi:hypothetical protein
MDDHDGKCFADGGGCPCDEYQPMDWGAYEEVKEDR